MVVPIFVFSLPRAGSTLLQRMLLSHDKVGGTAEPWVLLPFVYTLREYGTFSEYDYTVCHRAFTDFISSLPDKEETYLEALSFFSRTLYEAQLKPDEVYFLDKTPRYYLIIPEIAKMYPDAKFIFLFRNPLSVLSSMINTWYDGKMRLNGHYMDLIMGPRLLAEGYELLKDRSISIKYEDLIICPELTLSSIFDYLEVDFDKEVLHEFNNVNLSGRLGDHTGRDEYNSIESATLNKWKRTLNTRVRKAYAKKYLKKIGVDVLSIHGYKYSELVSQIDSIRTSNPGYIFDNYNLLVGFLLRILDCKLFYRKIKEKKSNKEKPLIEYG